ncbi:MAG: sensor histidine kinase [Ginsengibacter sp.]
MDATETAVYHSVIIACIAIGCILLLFFIAVIRQQREILSLRKKNAVAEMKGIERDRSRIAADLHDDLGPLLSSLKIRVTSFDLQNEHDKEELVRVKKIFDTAIQRIRNISFNLMPNTLVKKGLVKGLREYMDLLNNESKIHFTIKADAGLMVDEVKSVNIFRLLQEAIYNALKHSHATAVCVELTVDQKKNLFICTVTDDGVGFNYKKKLAERSGIGLGSLNNRVMVAGGKMSVRSSPGKGTSCIFEIPL